MYLYSIFQSISGEAGLFPQGSWCTFVRLQGCNLRCTWCDTKSAQETSREARPEAAQVEEIVDQCFTKRVLITGGEPLLQPETTQLIQALLLNKHEVQIETNGSLFIPSQFSDVGWVVDYKCPSSGMKQWMPPLTTFVRQFQGQKHVTVKFVLNDEQDLQAAFTAMHKMLNYGFPGMFALSPTDGSKALTARVMTAIEAAKHFPSLQDRIVFSLQLHKILGVN